MEAKLSNSKISLGMCFVISFEEGCNQDLQGVQDRNFPLILPTHSAPMYLRNSIICFVFQDIFPSFQDPQGELVYKSQQIICHILSANVHENLMWDVNSRNKQSKTNPYVNQHVHYENIYSTQSVN